MEHDRPPPPQPAPPVAAPAVAVPVANRGRRCLSMQRTVGNRAVCRAIASGMLAARRRAGRRTPTAGGAITGLSVSPNDATMPLESGVDDHGDGDAGRTPARSSRWRRARVAPAAGTKIDDYRQGHARRQAAGRDDEGQGARRPTDADHGVPGDREADGDRVDRRLGGGDLRGDVHAHVLVVGRHDGRPRTRRNINEKFDSTDGEDAVRRPDFKLTANSGRLRGLAPGQLGDDGRAGQRLDQPGASTPRRSSRTPRTRARRVVAAGLRHDPEVPLQDACRRASSRTLRSPPRRTAGTSSRTAASSR